MGRRKKEDVVQVDESIVYPYVNGYCDKCLNRRKENCDASMDYPCVKVYKCGRRKVK